MTFATNHTIEPDTTIGRPHRLPVAAALAREAAMLDAVAGGAAPQILVWQCERCIVVPRRLTSSAGFPTAAADLERGGFPVFVRNTGGDAVVQGPGVVNVSLAFARSPKQEDRIGEAYRILCAPLMALLKEHGIEAANGAIAGAMCDGAFNVTAMGRKLAGTAQRWRSLRGAAGFAVLGHLALSVDLDHAAAADAVNVFYAAAGIESRVRGDVHINMAELLGPISTDAVVESLASRYAAAAGRLSLASSTILPF